MISRRRKMMTGLQLETLEGRIALSTTAHPLHAAVAAHATQAHVAPVHAAAHPAPAVPNPVLVNLTPGVSGITITSVSYDARVHLITVKGTVDVGAQVAPPYYGYTPTYPTTSYVGLSATQAVSRLQSVSGSQYLNVPVADASVTTVPFKGRILAYAGKFQSGIISLSVTSSSVYYYSYNTLTVLVRMHNAKAF